MSHLENNKCDLQLQHKRWRTKRGNGDLMTFKVSEAILCFSLACNVGLAYYVHSGREAPGVRRPAVGQSAKSITGVDDSGAVVALSGDSAGRSTVLYVFSQTCVWCERTNPALRALLAEKGKQFRFVAADISSPSSPSASYLASNNLKFDRTVHPDAQTRERLGLNGTPDTLVIDPNDRIVKAFHGALIGPSIQSLNEFFGTHLVSDSFPAVEASPESGCIQDGLSFSYGAQICWDKHAYECGTKSWKETESACEKGMYVAKKRPGK